MRILIITNMYPYSGCTYAGVHVKRQVDALVETYPDDQFETLFLNTLEDRSMYAWGSVVSRRRESSFRPDVIHVHFGLTQWMALLCRTPQVLTLHGSDVHRLIVRQASRALSWRQRHVVFVDPGMAAKFGPVRSSSCIPCGVDTREFRLRDRAQCRYELGLSNDEVVVVFPGDPARFAKNYPLFEQTVQDLLRSHRVRPLVVNAMKPEEVPKRLAASDVVLFTSRYEGSAVLSKEAMCCGIPVVATDVGDFRTQLAGMGGCRVVGDPTPERLAEAVREALTDAPPDTLEAARRFGREAEARKLMDIYKRVAGGE